jgi:hypothetical protein
LGSPSCHAPHRQTTARRWPGRGCTGDATPDVCGVCAGDDTIDMDSDGDPKACDNCPNDATPTRTDLDGEAAVSNAMVSGRCTVWRVSMASSHSVWLSLSSKSPNAGTAPQDTSPAKDTALAKRPTGGDPTSPAARNPQYTQGVYGLFGGTAEALGPGAGHTEAKVA